MQLVGDHEARKQEKRRRVLEKIKFVMENSDVGGQVDPSVIADVKSDAPEALAYFDPDTQTFKGTDAQQRAHAYRTSLASAQDDPEDMMRRGLAAGVISPGSYAQYLSQEEARRSREEQARLTRESREEIARMNIEGRQDLARLAAALRPPRTAATDDETGLENNALGKSIKTARNYYGNDPVSYLVKNVFTPTATEESLAVFGDADLLSPSGVGVDWDKALMYVQTPEGIQTLQKFGVLPKEMAKLQSALNVRKNYSKRVRKS